MDNNTILTKEQTLLISFLGVLGNIVYIHTWIDDSMGKTAWVATFAGILLIMPFALWIYFLGKNYPCVTLFDIIKEGIGKTINILLGLIFIIINIAVATTQLNMFTEMINTFFLHNTPPWVIMTCTVFTGTLILTGKISSYARLIEFLAVIGVMNYFITFIFAFPNNVHFDFVTPVFDTSIWDFTKASFFIAGSAAECLLILMIFVRFVPVPDKHYSYLAIGIAISAVVFSIAILIIMAMMSPEQAKRIAFGGVNAARLVSVGEFIQGLEILVFVTYQFIALGKVSICIYCASAASKTMFSSKLPLLHLLTMTALVLTFSIMIYSYTKAYFIAVFLSNYVLIPFCILVLLLASISIKKINKKKEKV